MTVDELIEQSCSATAADPVWLGSDAHLALLSDALDPVFGLSGISLEWAAPGEPSFWERATRKIKIERPVPVPAVTLAELAKLTVLGLLHESFHAQYSTSFGSYETRRLSLDSRLWRAAGRLFQLFEDGRVNALGVAADRRLKDRLDEFVEVAVGQAALLAGKNGPGTSPASARNQLFFAVEAYALQPDQEQPLNHEVQLALAEITPVIDPTKTGTTEDCGIAALQVVRAIVSSRLPS